MLGLAVGIGVSGFLALVRQSGIHIPQPEIEADYLVALLWSMGLGLGILAWPVSVRDKQDLLVLWVIKVLVVLGFMLFYEYMYPLDSAGYFERASLSTRPTRAQDIGVTPGTTLIYVLSWYHNRVLPDSYHALKASFAMVGLVAIYLFYRACVRYLGHEDRRLLYLLGLFPSILFWSSTLGKDPIVLFGIALYVYGVVGWFSTNRPRFLLWLGLGVILATTIRLWLALILLLPLGVVVMRSVRGVIPRLSLLGLTLAGMAWGVSQFADYFALTALEDLYARTEALSRGWEGGSAQTTNLQVTSLGSMLAFVPAGAFTALFRPLPGEVMNPFGLLAGLENVFLLGLAFLALLRARGPVLRDPVIQWAVLLVLTWAAVYGFVSSQNLGAAVRFKLQILPVLVPLLLYLARKPLRDQGGTTAALPA